MKKIISMIFLLISGVLMLNLTACNLNRNTLVVAMSPDYAPFQFIDPRNPRRNNQHVVGADVELAGFIASKMEKELVIKPMQFRETLVAVQMGRVDVAISGFSWTEERAANFEMSIPYRIHSEDFEGLLISNDRMEEFETLNCFNNSNIRVAVQNASLQEQIVMDQLPNATIQRINTIQDGVMLLRSGSVDAVAIYSGTARLTIRSHPDLNMSNVRFETEEDEAQGLHIIARKGNSELMDKIDYIIKTYIVDEDVKYDLYVKWMRDAIELAFDVADHIARRRGE